MKALLNKKRETEPIITRNRLETRFSGLKRAEKVTFASDDILYPLKRNSKIDIRVLPAKGGFCMGAFLDGELAGEIRIRLEGRIAHYASSRIHREYHREGICQTLIYEAGKKALEEDAKQLIAEVDSDSRVAAIFRSLGFRTREDVLLLAV